MRRYKRRRKTKAPGIIMMIIAFLIVGGFLSILFRNSPESQAKKAATSFYKLEQKADYGSSWELFHHLMKEKFTKSNYIQQRSHVFMQDFGVSTFDLMVGKPKSISKWKMSKESPELKDVYQIPISQQFKSSFGTFTINQDVIVVQVKGEWQILWSYQ